MPRLAANISFLFAEAPFLARFALAAKAGFTGVEFHYPYAHDPYAIKDVLAEHALTPVLINIRAGDHAKGEWGFAGSPGRESTFRICVDEAIGYAEILGVKQINCLAGVRPIGVPAFACTQALIANLQLAATLGAEAGIAVNLEPLNTSDVPGYLVATSAYAQHVIESVGQSNLKLQFDWYHAAMMGEDVAAQMQSLLPLIGHMQFADAPGRHEPGTGGTDFANLFAQADAIGYTGWLSAEYRPSGKSAESFGWMEKFRAK
jgi:hydroxypyruvate isomerase